MTTLRNRCPVVDKPYCYIYNGLSSCADLSDPDEDGIGSFQHYVGRDDNVKQDGTYEIHTKVKLSCALPQFAQLTTQQITSYHPGINVTSKEFPDDSINILGDINSVCDELQSPPHLSLTLLKMQPLSNDKDRQLMYDDTMHVSVAGTVVAISNETSSFWIKAIQYISGKYNHIAVHGRMDKNRKWKQPMSVLPSTNTIIAFDGFLDCFESYTC